VEPSRYENLFDRALVVKVYIRFDVSGREGRLMAYKAMAGLRSAS
jgi:hypothetical protein